MPPSHPRGFALRRQLLALTCARAVGMALPGKAGLAAVALGAGCAARGPLLMVPAAGLPPEAELVHTPFFPDTAYHCGPAALAMVLAERGLPILPADLVQQVFLPARQGSLQLEMLGAARRAGVVPVRIPGELPVLLAEIAAGNPVVVLQNLGLAARPVWHYAVAIGYSLLRREIVLRSGPQHRQRLELGVFESTWADGDRWSFVVMPVGVWPATVEVQQVVDACIGFERVAPPDDALRTYSSAVQQWPDELALRIGLGNTAYASGNHILAADSFETAAREHRSAAAWINLGRTLLAAGLPESAWRVALEAEYIDDPAWRAETTSLLRDARAPLTGGAVDSGESFVRPQVAPLTGRQVAQHHPADPHPFQSQHLQAHRLAHAPDLPLAAFAQHESQLVLVDPVDLGRAQRHAVEL